ncbi:MAG: restriction endonuclease subunit S [Microcystaceae cyanobacterium]
MSITPEIKNLINRLQQELNELEQKTATGIDLVRMPLSQFPENTILVQFFAYLSNVIFFVSTYQRRITVMIESLSVSEFSNEEIQEAGEELSMMLGVTLETKIRVENLVNRLGD